MFSKDTYTSRRQQVKKTVGKGLLLLLGNEESSMNYKDNVYHFRQDSTFLYYIGLDKPGLAVIIDIDNDRELLFGNELTIDDIVWTGPQQALSDQASKTGITSVQPVSDIAGVLKTALSSNRTIHFLPPYRADNAQKLSEWLSIPQAALKEKASVTLIKAVVQQRSIKSAEEVAEIEKGVNITAAMHFEAMRSAAEGMTEAQIAGRLPGIAISAGGNLSFPTILTVNGQVLHNHYSTAIVRKGQMILCDAGAETGMHYAGDLTRTFPVDKTFSGRQREVYNIVLNAQQAAADSLRPGILFKDVHLLACEKLVEGLKDMGILKGDTKEAVQQGVHTLFFQCGLGHMMGLDVHDMEDLGEQYVGYTDDLKKSTDFGLKSLRLGRALEPGFVVTIEPGIYVIPELIDRWKAENKHKDFVNYDQVEAFRDFGGIRIEEDFLVTPHSHQLLGNPLAKSIAEVEAIRS